ncbi:hypothetical protein C2845_PM08G16590 [Panicum miliaceum]|uniref:Uncharacterized protein n=1 Tax=Panicum miliaceum TaxID=4540 RepID=A0A3L6R3N5_PANMI|nr:hypothetical protein C2845_PM08G16590 [Panicum miliaceum]
MLRPCHAAPAHGSKWWGLEAMGPGAGSRRRLPLHATYTSLEFGGGSKAEEQIESRREHIRKKGGEGMCRREGRGGGEASLRPSARAAVERRGGGRSSGGEGRGVVDGERKGSRRWRGGGKPTAEGERRASGRRRGGGGEGVAVGGGGDSGERDPVGRRRRAEGRG